MCKNNKSDNMIDRIGSNIEKETSMREATFEEATILRLNEIQESLRIIYEMLKEMER